MVLYECIPCNFRTNLKANFTRHQNTKKHGAKIFLAKKNPYMNQNEPKMNQNEPNWFIEKSMNRNEPAMNQNEPKKNESGNLSLNCMYCSKKFKTCASKRRHELHRCPKKDEFMVPNQVQKTETNTNQEVIEALREQNRLVQQFMEQKLEKFEAVLEEKERCIEILKDQIGTTSNHNTFNLIKNDIYTMKPLEFLNTFCINNPSLEEVIGMIQHSGLHADEQNRIREASAMKAKHAIAKEFDSILKSRNRELISNQPLTCDSVLFSNDGSNRRYIAKGQKEWQFYSTDEPLDSTTDVILDKVNSDIEEPILMNKKERTNINNSIKRLNDFSDIRKSVLEQLEHKNRTNQIENGNTTGTEVSLSEVNSSIGDLSDEDDILSNCIEYSSTTVTIDNESEVDSVSEPVITTPKVVYQPRRKYQAIHDCGRDYIYDRDNNVFDPETKEYVGTRVHDDEECPCSNEGPCWYYIKYLNEI